MVEDMAFRRAALVLEAKLFLHDLMFLRVATAWRRTLRPLTAALWLPLTVMQTPSLRDCAKLSNKEALEPKPVSRILAPWRRWSYHSPNFFSWRRWRVTFSTPCWVGRLAMMSLRLSSSLKLRSRSPTALLLPCWWWVLKKVDIWFDLVRDRAPFLL